MRKKQPKRQSTATSFFLYRVYNVASVHLNSSLKRVEVPRRFGEANIYSSPFIKDENGARKV